MSISILGFLAQTQVAVPQMPVPAGASPWYLFVLQSTYILICVALILCVLFQTTKSEGLSGVIGGTVSSVFRGKRSAEEKLVQWTSRLAVSFIVLSVVMWLMALRA